jgi:hypothetical protein
VHPEAPVKEQAADRDQPEALVGGGGDEVIEDEEPDEEDEEERRLEATLPTSRTAKRFDRPPAP